MSTLCLAGWLMVMLMLKMSFCFVKKQPSDRSSPRRNHSRCVQSVDGLLAPCSSTHKPNHPPHKLTKRMMTVRIMMLMLIMRMMMIMRTMMWMIKMRILTVRMMMLILMIRMRMMTRVMIDSENDNEEWRSCA